ncbi:DUF2625 domain-containing protein [Streptomyces sp. NBC_00454]|uniref:DUF2625 domain-containing protein n=1 Tax=Streptomyces sp. NBC_00454 TaxID=2975747 RepID=UPI002F907426
MRQLSELTDVDEPAWPLLQEQFANSSAPLESLPARAPEQGRACLLQLQVTARSWLGALALNSGGLTVDGGWLRVYGGATGDRDGLPALPGALPSLAQVNDFPAAFDPAWHPAAGLIVGHDVLGGVFALNGHDPAASGRPGDPGQMLYFAPDSLEWEALEMGYGAWLTWLLSGSLAQFYDGLRWPGWQAEAAALEPSQGIAVYPYLWSKEAHADLAATSRRAVPMTELLGLSRDFCLQFGPNDPGFLGSV